MTADERLIFFAVRQCCQGRVRWPWHVKRWSDFGFMARFPQKNGRIIRHKFRKVCRIGWYYKPHCLPSMDIYSLPLLEEFIREFYVPAEHRPDPASDLADNIRMLDAAWGSE